MHPHPRALEAPEEIYLRVERKDSQEDDYAARVII